MKVLADYHHGNLYYSLHLLFAKRLGMELYRPIGRDWFENGFFRVAEPYGNAEDTIGQYLAINNDGYIPFKNLNGDNRVEDEVYYVNDPENNFIHRAITFDKFKRMDFDLIIASHPLHGNWKELLQYQPKAKFIAQLGNEGQGTSEKNVLCSTADFFPTQEQNFIRYHQEFDLTDYKYTPPTSRSLIRSFVVSLLEPDTYFAYKNGLPEFQFEAYGVGSPEGTVSGSGIWKMMQESAFGYHIKPADGFGHIIHKWFASGRPVITKASMYKGKFAEPLLIDGETCIDLDKRDFDSNRLFIKKMAEPENHERMCLNARKRFDEIVNFDKEAERVKEWLAKLI